jgi:threonine dehydrogenase-like Zn-dependent dehydrogenase
MPYEDYGPRLVPDNLTDEQVLFLTDIFPTGYTGIDWGEVNGGETVVIFGASPVGTMAAKSAWLRGAVRVFIVDTLPYRLQRAKLTSGAKTLLWEDDPKGAIAQIRDATGGRGADVCVDAVGFEPKRSMADKAKAAINMEKGSIKVLEACMSAVRRGGIVSVLGVCVKIVLDPWK